MAQVQKPTLLKTRGGAAAAQNNRATLVAGCMRGRLCPRKTTVNSAEVEITLENTTNLTGTSCYFGIAHIRV